MDYKNKYLKYKLKYLNLKKKLRGGSNKVTKDNLADTDAVSMEELAAMSEDARKEYLSNLSDAERAAAEGVMLENAARSNHRNKMKEIRREKNEIRRVDNMNPFDN